MCLVQVISSWKVVWKERIEGNRSKQGKVGVVLIQLHKVRAPTPTPTLRLPILPVYRGIMEGLYLGPPPPPILLPLLQWIIEPPEMWLIKIVKKKRGRKIIKANTSYSTFSLSLYSGIKFHLEGFFKGNWDKNGIVYILALPFTLNRRQGEGERWEGVRDLFLTSITLETSS